MASRNSHRLARRWRRLGGEAAHKEQQRWCKRGGRKKRRRNGRKEAAGLKKKKGKNLIYPMVHIKQVTNHSSVLQITGVSSQTVVFRRDLRTRGLRSTIGAMDQKVKILVNSGASLNQI
jgi:hypothetical protein